MRRCTFLVCSLLCSFACDGDPEPGEPGGYGDSCTDMCATDLSCVLDARFPGGYCTSVCDGVGCPSGAICDEDRAPALCLASCAAPADCRSGYQCWRGACRPACASDTDCLGGTCVGGTCDGPECMVDAECPAGSVCQSNMCVPLVDGGLNLPLGAVCGGDGDCLSGMCLAAADGGTCTVSCGSIDDCLDASIEMGCSALPDGAGVRTVCTPVPAGGREMGRACTLDVECIGRTCQEGQCTEVCSSTAACLPGQTCTALTRGTGTYMGCGYAPATAVTVEEVPLGSNSLLAGQAVGLSYAIPPDAVSVTLRALRTSGDPLDLTFGTVDDPSGATLFDVEQIAMLVDTPIRWLPSDTGEVITMLVPNTTPDRVAFRGGLYTFSAGTIPRSEGDSGRATVEMSALIKRAPGGAVASGTLDVTVFLVGVGLTTATAPSNGKLQGALTRLDTVLGRTGVRLGAVEYVEVTGADASALQVINSAQGGDSELARLFRLSEGRVGRRLDIFLVRSIETGDEGFAALGIAGGIPGPVGMHGTQHSGVVAAFDNAVVGSGSSGAAVVGHILAHEAGHYLGLYHATERLRACGAGETPEDGCSPFNAGDTLADTARGSTNNLMYWSIIGAGSNETLSAGQGFVLRASALVGP